MNDEQIERLLRKAPRPPAPAELLGELQSDIVAAPEGSGAAVPAACAGVPPAMDSGARHPSGRRDACPTWRENAPVNQSENRPLVRRWFPAVSFAALFLSCILAIGVQTNRIVALHRENESLLAATQDLEKLRLANGEYQKLVAAHEELQALRKDFAELQNLRKEVAQLRAQQQEADRLRAENQQLLAASRAAQPISEDDFFARTGHPSEKAMSIQCVNNLKQIGLSARVWANDDPYNLGRQDVFPPNFLSMSNELATPKILVCPADKARKPAVSWQEFGAANVSYEFLNPNGSETNPYVLLTRCPIHGHVGLSDGSVFQGSGLGRSFSIVVVDGKQTFAPLEQPARPDPAAMMRRQQGLPPNSNQVPPTNYNELMLRRYGLIPTNAPPSYE